MASLVLRILTVFLAGKIVESVVEPVAKYEPTFPATRVGRESLRKAEQCGFYGVKPGQVISVQSSNFNKVTANFETCTWKILGHRCALKVACPCVDVPEGGDCGADYLKISDTSSLSQRLCGGDQPTGIYNATSSFLTLSYRFDGREVTNGFICFVSCTGKGQRDPSPLRAAPVTCRQHSF